MPEPEPNPHLEAEVDVELADANRAAHRVARACIEHANVSQALNCSDSRELSYFIAHRRWAEASIELYEALEYYRKVKDREAKARSGA